MNTGIASLLFRYILVSILLIELCCCTIINNKAPEQYAHVLGSQAPQVTTAGAPSIKPAGTPITIAAREPKLVSPSFFAHIPNVHDEITCSIQYELIDKDGNLWFSYRKEEEVRGVDSYELKFGEDGLCCYDGNSFKIYGTEQGLIDSNIECMTADKKGNLWIGTLKGISCFDGKSFTNYTREQGVIPDYISCIATDTNNNIWFGTIKGVNCFDGKNFIRYTKKDQGLSDDDLCGLMVDGHGNIWFATLNGGAICYNGKTFTTYTENQGLPCVGFDKRNKCMMEDSKGNLWFITGDYVLSEFDRKKFNTFNSFGGIGNTKIFCMAEDKNGTMWFGAKEQFISYDGKKFTFYPIPNFPDYNVAEYNEELNTVHDANRFKNLAEYIVTDKNGNLLFGTYKSGIVMYDGKKFSNFFAKQ